MRRKKPKKFRGRFDERTVLEHFNLRKTKGDIAFEVEVEYRRTFDRDILPLLNQSLTEKIKDWVIHYDGSLRNGLEFVSSGPAPARELDGHVTNLQTAKEIISKTLGEHLWSIRTSTHLHINVQHLTMRQVLRVCSFYWLLEDFFVQTQGPLREGNLFCLRASDAEDHPRQFLQEFRQQTIGGMDRGVTGNNWRYSSLNLAALAKFGSLEFRFLRGMFNPEELSFWGRVLYNLIENGKDREPRDLFHYEPRFWVPDLIGTEAMEVIEEEYGGLDKINDRILALAPLFAVIEDKALWDVGEGDFDYRYFRNPDIEEDAPVPVDPFNEEDFFFEDDVEEDDIPEGEEPEEEWNHFPQGHDVVQVTAGESALARWTRLRDAAQPFRNTFHVTLRED